jgi:DNA-binding LytR/AlgR family response regulator
MLKCVIIDDEPLAIQLLAGYAKQVKGLSVAGTYTDPIRGLQALEKIRPDLIFLDIQMPQLSGTQFARIVKGKYPVVLTTAYQEFALEGYELDVVDYLLKPVTFERFTRAIEKFRSSITGKPLHDQSENVPAVDARGTIFIKSGYKTLRLDVKRILYIEGLSDYLRIQTLTGPVLTLDTMTHMLELLSGHHFVRVHKSYIVALDKIDYIERNRIVIADKFIPISTTYQETFWKAVNGR